MLRATLEPDTRLQLEEAFTRLPPSPRPKPPIEPGKGRLWRTGATTRRLTHAAFGVSIAMRVCVLVLRHLVCARLRLWRWHPDEAVTNATFELNINDWNFGHCSLVDSACSLTRNLSRLCLDQTHEGQADALQTA
jgi:hypothetical protein